MDEIIKDDNYCFACGEKNPKGLRLKIHADATGAMVEKYIIKKEYQGYADIVHGGIISTILDELQVYAAAGKGFKTVTARIEVKFLKPVKVGVPINAKAHVVSIKKDKWIETQAEIIQEGVVKAKSQAILRVVE